MANYEAAARTNFFRVTDEKRYEELFSGLRAEGGVLDISQKDEKTGMLYHGFAAYDSIDYAPDTETDEPWEFDYFLEELQKIIPEDEAFIYREVGHEKLRYVTGFYVVVTRDHIDSGELGYIALRKAREFLNNPEFKTYF